MHSGRGGSKPPTPTTPTRKRRISGKPRPSFKLPNYCTFNPCSFLPPRICSKKRPRSQRPVGAGRRLKSRAQCRWLRDQQTSPCARGPHCFTPQCSFVRFERGAQALVLHAGSRLAPCGSQDENKTLYFKEKHARGMRRDKNASLYPKIWNSEERFH